MKLVSTFLLVLNFKEIRPLIRLSHSVSSKWLFAPEEGEYWKYFSFGAFRVIIDFSLYKSSVWRKKLYFSLYEWQRTNFSPGHIRKSQLILWNNGFYVGTIASKIVSQGVNSFFTSENDHNTIRSILFDKPRVTVRIENDTNKLGR